MKPAYLSPNYQSSTDSYEYYLVDEKRREIVDRAFTTSDAAREWARANGYDVRSIRDDVGTHGGFDFMNF